MRDTRLEVSRRGALAGATALGVATAFGAKAASGPALQAEIDAASSGRPISPFLYGGFLEHIGDLINHSLWSEVLDDRKFYWPVNSEPVPAPPGRSGGPARDVRNKWRPTGADSTVTMDAAAPYVGKQSPVGLPEELSSGKGPPLLPA